MKNRGRKVAVRIAAVFVVLGIGGWFLFLYRPGPPIIPPLPNPNGYDDLLQAISLIPEQELEIYQDAIQSEEEVSSEVIRLLLEKSSNALQVARQGLERESRVPLEFTQEYWDKSFENRVKLRRIGDLFRIEGRFHEEESQPVAAIESYLDMIRLGFHTSRGGIGIDWLIGTASIISGISRIQLLRSTIDTQSKRDLVVKLEELSGYFESMSVVEARDRAFERAAFSLWERLQVRFVDFTPLYQIIGDVNLSNRVALFNLFTIDLAIELHHTETGNYPESLADLVPGFLKKVPGDPHSENGFRYRVRDKKYLLYSVGPDGIDDGGVQPLFEERGDVSLQLITQ